MLHMHSIFESGLNIRHAIVSNFLQLGAEFGVETTHIDNMTLDDKT